MRLSQLWGISRKFYREIVFQSSFSLRTGGVLPQQENFEKNVKTLVKSAEKNIVFSKIVMTLLIVLYGIIPFIPGVPIQISKELFAVFRISTILGIILFMLGFMSLQVTTSFISARVSDILIPLISKDDVSKVIILCFIRIFDIQLIAAALVIPIAYGILSHSILGGFAALLSIIITEVFALALAVYLAISFHSKVIKGGGRSIWKTLTRILYMLVWAASMFLGYMIISFVSQIFSLMANLTQEILHLLALIYPFSLGFLVSFATFLGISDFNVFILSTVSSLIYFALAAYSFKWLVKRIMSIGTGIVISAPREKVKDIIIKPVSPWLGIIKKDLRIASRSPSYFSVFIMPIVQTVFFSLILIPIAPGLSGLPVLFFPPELIPLLLFVSIMVLISPPIFLGIESVAYAYIGSLPLRKRTLILAKAILSSTLYLASLLILFLIALLSAPSFTLTLLIFGGIYTLTILASVIIELTLLYRIFGKTIPSGDMYSKLYLYIISMMVGSTIVIIPFMVYYLSLFLIASTVLNIFVFSLVSALELILSLFLIIKKS